MVDAEDRVDVQDETPADISAFDLKLLNEIRAWLGEQVLRFAFSDITVSFTIHEREISKVQRSVTEKNLQRLRRAAAAEVEHAVPICGSSE